MELETSNPSDATWKLVSALYLQSLTCRADSKSNKDLRTSLLSLDSWYQNELPTKIQQRKPLCIYSDELCEVMKWKLARGKFRPRLQQMVESNSPEVVKQVSTESYEKLIKGNMKGAVESLCQLKGVGPATASAILAVGCPTKAAFMSDESTMKLLGRSLKYNIHEYMELMEKLLMITDSLQAQDATWTVQKVQETIWTWEVLRKFQPELLPHMDKSSNTKKRKSTDDNCSTVLTKSKRT